MRKGQMIILKYISNKYLLHSSMIVPKRRVNFTSTLLIRLLYFNYATEKGLFSEERK